MKAWHIINLVLIVFLLGGICTIEEVYVSKALKSVQDQCFEIERMVEERDSIKDMEFVLAIDNLEYSWTKNETTLCYMVNHKNIQEIGQEISKIKMYIASDDIDALKVSTQTLRMYCHSYLHFMGANIHNVL